MAKDSWLDVSPMEGDGNATLINSSTLYKGRIERQEVVTAVAKGIEAARSYEVKQSPTPEYIILDKTSFNVGEDGSTITISGKSNSPEITFALGTGNDIPIALPDNYVVNGFSTANGGLIPEDPGSVDEFTFSVKISIPRNTVGERTGKITVTGSIPTIMAVVTVTQATSTLIVTYSKGDYINTINKVSEKINWGNTATATAALLTNTSQYTYSFLGWYEGGTKISSLLELSVPNIISNRTFTAIGSRTLNRYTLAFVITPTGAGTVSGGGTYDYGLSIKSTATPANGYNFTKWVDEEGGEHIENPYSGWLLNKNRTIQAVFTIKSYIINLSPQFRVAESGDFITGETGGTVSGGGTINHGTSVTAKATPANGYNFVGWYEGDLKVSDSSSYTFIAAGTLSLTARFQRQWFTVTFTAGTGGSVSPTFVRVQYGGEASSIATASTGYTFSGWSDGTSTATLTVMNVMANAIYAASFGINIYVITYLKGMGIFSVTPTSETVEHGSDAQGSTAELTTGYNFDGWYNGDIRVSTSLFYAPENVNGNMTLTAKGVNQTFSITGIAQYRDTYPTGSFINGTNGGTVTGSGSYIYGAKAILTAVEKVGYTFQGWYDASGTLVRNLITYEIVSVTAAVTVYARFQRNWLTVTYVRGMGIDILTKTSEQVAYNGSVTSETAVASLGYNTPTWTKTSGTGTLTVTAGTATLSAIQSDCTLRASASINTYVISYTKNENIATISKTSESINYGGTATCTATLFTNTAQYTYSFLGWYEGGVRVSTGFSLSVSNITSTRAFEARGTATVNRYTITVTNGSGSGTYNYETKVLLTASTIEGKTFSKWSDGVTTASREIIVTANASYTAEYVTSTYTVTYVRGTGVSSISRTSEVVNWGENAIGCTATVSSGHTFDGWYNGSTRVSTSLTYAPTNIKSNLSFTAQSIINTYTVEPFSYYRETDGVGNYISKYRQSVVFNNQIQSGGRAIGFVVDQSGSIWLDNMKLERGNTATGWSPAPEDFQGFGANLVRNNTTFSPYSGAVIQTRSRVSVAEWGATDAIRMVMGGGTNTIVAIWKLVSPTPAANTVYSQSGYFKNNSQTVTISISMNTGLQLVTLPPGETTRFTYDGYVQPNDGQEVQFQLRTTSIGEMADLTYWHVKAEYGSKATNWSPAPEDMPLSRNLLVNSDFSILNNSRWVPSSDGNYSLFAENGELKVVGAASRTPAQVNDWSFVWYTQPISELFNENGNFVLSFDSHSDKKCNLYFRANYLSYPEQGGAVHIGSDKSIGGTVSGGGVVNYGGNITLTATPSVGYQFDGWYSSGASGGTLLSSSLSYVISGVTSSISAYARFTKKYFTISYLAGDYVSGVNLVSERVAYGENCLGSTMTILASTTQYSYGVDGWYNGTTKVTAAASYSPTNVTANATYTAKGTRSLRSYTVSYTKNAYIASVSRTSEAVNYGSNAAGSTATIMPSDTQYSYGFDGWYNGSTRVSTSLTYAPTNITSEVTLEARGTRSARLYTISASLDSSSTGRGSVSGGGSYSHGALVTVVCTKTNGSDVFDGWYEGSTRVSTNLSYQFTVTGARNLVAKITYLDVTPTSLPYASTGGSQTFKITTNVTWSIF